jgi:hypothetical protein
VLWRHDSYVDRARAGIPSILERRYDLPERVKIELDDDQALVLFDWLCHLNDGEAPVVTHQAEQRVLWDIQADLEAVLVAPFESNYTEMLAQAQKTRCTCRPIVHLVSGEGWISGRAPSFVMARSAR